MSLEWDVNDYKTTYESDEHWELRKNFMLAHKDKLPEDEVVCLAQVFVNIELLGCRYPPETMERVAELAKGVVEEYREKRKTCLKRTFVAASDAALAKVKGQTALPEVSQVFDIKTETISDDESRNNSKSKSKKKTATISKPNCEPITRFIKVEPDDDYEPAAKIMRTKSAHLDKIVKAHTDTQFSNNQRLEPREATYRCIWDSVHISPHNNCHTEVSNEGKQHLAALSIAEPTFCDSITMDPINVKKFNELHPRFVFFLYNENPLALLNWNAELNNGSLRWCVEGPDDRKTCSVYYNEILLGSTISKNMKKGAKERAATEAIKNLRNLCYTVKTRRHVRCVNKVTAASLGPPPAESEEKEDQLKSDIGEQIMKLMGWSGGGLGVKQQGRTQPVSLSSNTGRGGLGLRKKDDKQLNIFRSRAKKFVKKWMKTECEEDLVFSSEFTESQRGILHEIAASLKLRAKSYGKGADRYLVIFRNPVPWDAVENIVRMGGSTNRYDLMIPTITID